MLIYVLDILLVLLQAFGIQASVEYFELSSNVLWDEAITLKNCNIALPAVTVNQNKYTVEIEYELTNKEVWVGYYSMMTVFEYIGCVPINVAHATHMLPLEENGPGACYTLCRRSGKNTVGISQGECFCIDKELENSYNNVDCNLKCYKPIGLVCGGVKHMSVYRANLDATQQLTATSDNCYCLQIQRYESQNTTSNSWAQCGSDLRGICLNDDYQSFSVLKGPGQREAFPWINYTKLHMKQCSSPLIYNDILLIETNRLDPTWSGLIRSEVRYIHKELAEGHQHIKYGYLTKRNNDTVLNFATYDAPKRSVLCQNSSSGTTDNVNSKNRKGSDVVIPVVVTVVLSLVIIAVVIVILKRRETIQDFCKRLTHRNESGNNRPEIDMSNKIVKKSTSYQSHDLCSETTHNDYSDIDDASIVKDDNSYTHTYFVLEEHERQSDSENTAYNIAGSREQTRDTETDNVYNKLKLDTTATYDQACIKKEIGVNTSEDTYDTAATAALRLKAQASQSSDGFGEMDDEDDYSHTNDTMSENNKADNVCGQPNQFENGTVASGEIHFSERDAYSHIIHNNRPDKSNPDNI